MAAAETSSPDVSQAFLRKLEVASTSLRSIALLSILGGVFALVFMVLWATHLGMAVLNVAHVSFLVGGAIAFAIGLGLLNYSGGARAAGSLWFLVWGIPQLVVGCAAAWQGNTLIGVLCMVGGAAMVVFSHLLRLPAEIFVCDYVGGDLSAPKIDEGILEGEHDTRRPAMAEFVATARPAEAAEVPPEQPE